MTKKLLWIVPLAMLLGNALYAQDIAGVWQGTLPAGKPLRIVLHITKAESRSWSGALYSIDQGPTKIPISSITLQGSNLNLAIDAIGGAYEGMVGADDVSIQGTWTQGKALPLPLKFERATKETAWTIDPSPHTVQFITVDTDVKLEVLDWGGSGSPLVFLAGLGNTAHIFDKFAVKLTPMYHVYGITRRGFGDSSAPSTANDNYSADRLGDDVLAVLDALKLSRPILVGHSIAGEELSSIGSRHPEKVAGLIYLDAGYSYAFYSPSNGDMNIDLIDLRKELANLVPNMPASDQKVLIQDLLQTSLPRFEKDLQDLLKMMQAQPAPPPNDQASAIDQAIMAGEQKYKDIHVPVLAIYALPHNLGPVFQNDPAKQAAADAR